MERKTFKECLESIPGLSQNLITQLIVRLRSANERIEALSILDVSGRVARQILTLAEEYGESTPPRAPASRCRSRRATSPRWWPPPASG